VIAVDLVGMGKLDKPDMGYAYDDHLRYVEGFIDTLDSKNITLVIHDWGSVIGLDYASRNQDNGQSRRHLLTRDRGNYRGTAQEY